jgi:hypothetical protein
LVRVGWYLCSLFAVKCQDKIILSNFFGWFLGAALITAAAHPKNLPECPLLAVYTLTWVLETFGLAVFWGLPGPALCGFVGMGVLVVLAWRATPEKA